MRNSSLSKRSITPIYQYVVVFLVSGLFLDQVNTFPWYKRLSPRDDTLDPHSLSDTSNSPSGKSLFSTIQEMDRAMQLGSSSLGAYDQRPSCFREATRALKQGCKNIEIDEEEKILYAVRLTACEIATADIPMPKECHLVEPSITEAKLIKDELGQCVQSLGRVPQLWTSYSGYFREVKLMCYAVSYSLEQVDFREAQRNLTRAHVEHMASLKEQQRLLYETQKLEISRLRQVLDLQSGLQSEIHSILSDAGALKRLFDIIHQDLSMMTRELSDSSTQQSTAVVHIQSLLEKLWVELRGNIQETTDLVADSIQKLYQNIDNGMDRSRELEHQMDHHVSALQTAGRDVDMFSKALSLTETRVMAMNVMIFEGSEAVSDLHTQMVSKIDTLTLDLTHNLTEAVHDFENKSLGAWSGMEQVIQLWQSNFQDEMSLILQHARSEIEMTALQSRGRLEDLDQLIDSVHSKHLAVFGFLKRLYEYLGAFQATLQGTTLQSFLVFALFLFLHIAISGFGTTMIQCLLSIALSIFSGRMFSPTTFFQSFALFVCARPFWVAIKYLRRKLSSIGARSSPEPTGLIEMQAIDEGAGAGDNHEPNQRASHNMNTFLEYLCKDSSRGDPCRHQHGHLYSEKECSLADWTYTVRLADQKRGQGKADSLEYNDGGEEISEQINGLLNWSLGSFISTCND